MRTKLEITNYTAPTFPRKWNSFANMPQGVSNQLWAKCGLEHTFFVQVAATGGVVTKVVLVQRLKRSLMARMPLVSGEMPIWTFTEQPIPSREKYSYRFEVYYKRYTGLNPLELGPEEMINYPRLPKSATPTRNKKPPNPPNLTTTVLNAGKFAGYVTGIGPDPIPAVNDSGMALPGGSQVWDYFAKVIFVNWTDHPETIDSVSFPVTQPPFHASLRPFGTVFAPFVVQPGAFRSIEIEGLPPSSAEFKTPDGREFQVWLWGPLPG